MALNASLQVGTIFGLLRRTGGDCDVHALPLTNSKEPT